jgi:hypothetical protein
LIGESYYEYALFNVEPKFKVELKYNGIIEGIENWQKVVLIYQSNYAKYISNHEILSSSEIGTTHQQEMIEHVSSVVKRHESVDSFPERTIDHLLIVKDQHNLLYLVVPIKSEYGIDWSCYDWVDGAWKWGAPSITKKPEFDLSQAIKIDDMIPDLCKWKKIIPYSSDELNKFAKFLSE